MLYCKICGEFKECHYRQEEGRYTCDDCETKKTALDELLKKQASCKLALVDTSPSSQALYTCPTCQDLFKKEEFKQVIEKDKALPLFTCPNDCLLNEEMYTCLQEDYEDLDLTLFRLRKPSKTQDELKQDLAIEKKKAQAWVQPLLFGLEWYKCWQCKPKRNIYTIGQFSKVPSRNESIPFFYRCPCGHLTASTKMERVENV